MSARTYTRAKAGYDDAHELELARAIMAAIAKTSMVTDANAMVLRTGEMINALLRVLAVTLALSPYARSPTALRTATDELAKRLRRLAREALEDPDFRDSTKTFFRDSDVGGHA
jgi:hypothetical protein